MYKLNDTEVGEKQLLISTFEEEIEDEHGEGSNNSYEETDRSSYCDYEMAANITSLLLEDPSIYWRDSMDFDYTYEYKQVIIIIYSIEGQTCLSVKGSWDCGNIPWISGFFSGLWDFFSGFWTFFQDFVV